MDNETIQLELVTHPRYIDYTIWKEDNQYAYNLFKKLSLALVNKQRRFGMWLVANRIRWSYFFKYDAEFKICNDYIALITRDLMLEIPELKKYCKIKRLGER